jgi:hypothetical protein
MFFFALFKGKTDAPQYKQFAVVVEERERSDSEGVEPPPTRYPVSTIVMLQLDIQDRFGVGTSHKIGEV